MNDGVKMKETNIEDQIDFITSLEIICVGTELLMGQIVNTNASFLAKQMSMIGIPSYYQSVVGDNPHRLQTALKQGISRSDAIILTGGLGPTADDITMEITAKTFGIDLVLHEESVLRIKEIFAYYNRPLTPNNNKQAMLPKGCIILQNDNGTAPGAIIEVRELVGNGLEKIYKKKALILLPGPPSEMQHMFLTYVKPYLSKRAPIEIKSKFVRLFGIGESSAETKLKDLIEKQTNPTIAPYCSDGECMFRITTTSDKQNILENDIDSINKQEEMLIDEVKARLGEYIYEVGDRNMPKVVFDLLYDNNKTVSFAESCTAGLATSMIADIPGTSNVLVGSIVCYNDSVKENILKVNPITLKVHGAVSEQTSIEMANGCKELLKSDYCVSITGIAGPGGGSEEKKVGLVYVCVCGPNSMKVTKFNLRGSRSKIRYISALNAFNMLRRMLLDDQSV